MCVVEAVDVRPHQADIVLPRHIDHFLLQGLFADLGKAGRNQNCPRDFFLPDFSQYLSNKTRRDTEDRDVDPAWDIQHALVALAP